MSPQVVIEQFGTSTTKLETSIKLTGTGWTLRWAAPELLNGEQPDLASDIWAFAWICWEARGFEFSPPADVADSSSLSYHLDNYRQNTVSRRWE